MVLNQDFIKKIDECFKLEKYQEAVELANTEILKNPKLPDGYIAKALTFVQLGTKFDEILDISDIAENLLGKKDYHICYARSCAYSALGEIEKALECLNETLELEPDFLQAYLLRADVYTVNNIHTKAIADYTKVIERGYLDADVFAKRAQAKYNIADKEGAKKDYGVAIELNPNNSQYYYYRANLNFTISDIKYAIDDLKCAIKLEPNVAEYYYALSCAMNLDNDFQGCINAVSKALELEPDNIRYLKLSAKSKLMNGDCSESIKDYTKLIELNKNVCEYYEWRAWAYEAKNDYKNALDDYKKAIECYKNDVNSMTTLDNLSEENS